MFKLKLCKPRTLNLKLLTSPSFQQDHHHQAQGNTLFLRGVHGHELIYREATAPEGFLFLICATLVPWLS